MTEFLADFWNLITLGLAGLIWALRLEGRITRIEDQMTRDRELANQTRVENNAMFKEMRDNSTRILEKLSASVKHLGHPQ